MIFFFFRNQGKLEMIVGLPASCMELEVLSVSGDFLQKMDNNDALLGSYPVDNNCTIHVSNFSNTITVYTLP